MTVTVILCAGQSNALGAQVIPFGVPANLQTPDSNIKIWNGSAFVTLQNGVNNDIHASGNGTWWGPEAEFSRLWRLAHPADTLYLVKSAVSGISLADNGGGPNNTWAPNPIFTSNWFPQMTTYVTDAKAALSGQTPVVEALLWMQGESDAGGSSATAYQTNLTAFFTAVRSSWGSASMKILLGRINDHAWGDNIAAVRAAQNAVVAADGAGKSALIDTDAYPRQSDDGHYSATGLVRLGSDMFDMLTITATTNRRFVKIGS